MGWRWRVALVGTLAVAACAADPGEDTLTNGNGARRPGSTASLTPSTKMEDADALHWLTRECSSCHGIDPATGTRAEYYSAWPMPAEGVTRSFLEVSELTAVAYQTLRHAALGVTESPAAMPPKATDAKIVDIKRVIDWFQRAIPYAVIDADARYGNASASKEKVLVQFECKHPSNVRAFLSRMTYGTFDRPPTAAELAWFSPAELGAPITPAQRQLIVSKLDGEWRSELVDIGLRKLATVVGGAPGIQPNGNVTPEVARDLRDELYNSFATHYDDREWGDYFTANTVMASPRTAPLYGGSCTASSGWKECTLEAPRGGFFTTLGFLNSRPQSFLLESNNHGRVASLFFTLFGEALLAATDGPTGGKKIPPLPECLENTDTRAFQGAPRGSAAVPEFGKVCQSCHVSRHMAAGSILFRPFATTGAIYRPGQLGQEGTPDFALFKAAVVPQWSHRDGAVTEEFLSSLVTASPRSCIATGKSQNPWATVSSVNDLATQLIANRSAFARGFMRHAHRAFSNLTSINLEMGMRALGAFEEGRRKLPDLIKAYWLTDTIACEAER